MTATPRIDTKDTERGDGAVTLLDCGPDGTRGRLLLAAPADELAVIRAALRGDYDHDRGQP